MVFGYIRELFHFQPVHCSGTGWFPFLNTTILDFSALIRNFHRWQYSYILLICSWRVSGDSENITKSSAYNNKKKRISSMVIPALGLQRWLSRSLIYIANKNGDKHSPCLTPSLHSSGSDFSQLLNTFAFIQLYIERRIWIILPRRPSFDNLYHKLSWTTKSNALL